MRDLVHVRTRQRRKQVVKELPHLPVADEVHSEAPDAEQDAEG